MIDPKPSSNGPPQASQPRAGQPVLSGYKKLVFALATTGLFLLALELVLAIAGVRPLIYSEDPFVSFTGRSALFVPRPDAAGQPVMTTAPNRRQYFNLQRFERDKRPGTYRIFTLGGSTTYGRPYDDKASFSGWLRRLLPAADPSRNWQVINAGGISYASYRVAVVLEELIQYKPDLIIIYTGHNEFLERRSYVDNLEGTTLPMRVAGMLAHTRIYTAARGFIGPDRKSPAPTLNAEVDAILDRSIGPAEYRRDDALREQIIAHFRFNLDRMVTMARSAGAEVVLVTPGSNLKDCSPFRSQHSNNLNPQMARQFQQFMSQVRRAERNHQFEDALAGLDQATAIDDRYAQLHFQRGRVLYALGRYEDAKAAFGRAVEEDICPLRAPGSITEVLLEVAAARGVMLVDFARSLEVTAEHGIPGTGQFIDHVHPTLGGYRKLALQLIDTLADRGIVTFSDHWHQATIDAVAREVESLVDPIRHGQALRTLARVFAWAGKHDQALGLARQALAVLSDDPETHSLMGRSHAARGELDKAIEHYQRSLAIDPDSALVNKYLGATFQLSGDLAQALRHYERGLELQPDDGETHYNLGTLRQEQGQFDEAVKHYHDAIGKQPDLAEAHHNLGRISALKNEFGEAIRFYRRALAINSNFALVHEQLAELLLRSGQFEQAIWHYERCLELTPDSTVALNSLAWVLATGPDARLVRPDEALRLAKRAAALTANASVLDTLAAAYAASGQFDQAVSAGRQALALAVKVQAMEFAELVRDRIRLYQQKRPYRQMP